MGWVHGFHNSLTGSLLDTVTGLPLGASTTIKSDYDAFLFGLHITFGPAPKHTQTAASSGEGAFPIQK